MRKQHIILSCLLVLFCGTATAQFKKALPNLRGNGQASDAKVNIGLLGGGNFTLWQHFKSAQTADWYLANYKPTLRFGYFGGIAVEYMLNNHFSVGLNAIYEQHNVGLNYMNPHFPTGFNQHMKRNYDLTADYNSIEVYTPVTFYINIGSKNLKPYFFVAPRASYILGGKMEYTRTDYDIETGEIIGTPLTSTANFSDTTYQMINVGGMAGIGTQIRFNTSNYYFLVKIDLSANVNGIQTFTKYDLLNEFNHLRFSGDAHATVTFLLPLKKRLVGACVKWGEYD